MAKNEYFSHDYNARQDPKILALIQDHGMEGYGCYWVIVEILHQQGGYINRKLSKPIAFNFHINENVVTDVFNKYGLFNKTKANYYSKRVLANIAERQKKSAIAKENGRLGGIAKRDSNSLATAKEELSYGLADDKQQLSNSLAIKSNKIYDLNDKEDNKEIYNSARVRERLFSKVADYYNNYFSDENKLIADEIINVFSDFASECILKNKEFTYSNKNYSLLDLEKTINSFNDNNLARFMTKLKAYKDNISDRKHYIIAMVLNNISDSDKRGQV